MKKIVILAIALCSITFAANAQNYGGNGHGQHQPPTPEKITEMMADQLMLSEAQGDKVLELNKEYQDVLFGMGRGHGGHGNGHHPGDGHDHGQKPDGHSGATTEGGHGNGNGHGQRPEMTEEQKAKFEEMRKKREEYETKLKAILTDEQKAKYEEITKRGPHGPQGGHGNGHGNGHDKDNKGGNGKGGKK